MELYIQSTVPAALSVFYLALNLHPQQLRGNRVRQLWLQQIFTPGFAWFMRILLNRCYQPRVAVAQSIRHGYSFPRSLATQRTKSQSEKKRETKKELKQLSFAERVYRRFQGQNMPSQVARVDIVGEQLCGMLPFSPRRTSGDLLTSPAIFR